MKNYASIFESGRQPIFGNSFPSSKIFITQRRMVKKIPKKSEKRFRAVITAIKISDQIENWSEVIRPVYNVIEKSIQYYFTRNNNYMCWNWNCAWVNHQTLVSVREGDWLSSRKTHAFTSAHSLNHLSEQNNPTDNFSWCYYNVTWFSEQI